MRIPADFLILEPAGRVVVVAVVAAVEAANHHSRARVLGVDELAIADVDANVADVTASACTHEEHEISGLPVTPGNCRTISGLEVGAMGDVVPEHISNDVLCESAAVKPGWRVACPHIWVAVILNREVHDLLTLTTDHWLGRRST